MRFRSIAVFLLLLGGGALDPLPAQRPDSAAPPPPEGRSLVEALTFPPLHFDPPPVREAVVLGVPVFHLDDPTLPLVDLLVRFEGGYAHFPRADYAAATAFPSLLRGGGTRARTPDEVEAGIDSLAIQLTFGSGGGALSSTLNTLTETLDPAVQLWWSMLLEPRFDTAVVEVWRGRRLEEARRSGDDPATFAFAHFNRIMYGDHPIGWDLTADDLGPAALTPARLRALHRQIVCRENLTLGVAGDLRWEQAVERLRRLIEQVPPCPAPLPPQPEPTLREGGGVVVIPRPLEQSVVVLAHATDLTQADDPAWFASRIGDAILGTGGLSSRLMSRLRTREGLVYSASSFWTTPREHPGLVGVTTRTAPGTTTAALHLTLEMLEEMTRTAPTPTEVAEAVAEQVNGFVFAFDSPATIVARRMTYHALGLPDDWLERTVAGTAAVTPEAIREVFGAHLDPSRMTILVVGDPDRLDAPLETLGVGPVVVIDPATPSAPSGSPRSRR